MAFRQIEWVRCGSAAFALASAFPALAQRANENALRSAEDAFGVSIGRESIGLYSASDVRGFSPSAAGNIRLEGLYIDTPAGLNGRLVQGSTVRVGISSQGYSFPAPTGIADYRLRLPGDQAAMSALGAVFSDGSFAAEVDSQLPLTESLGFAGGASYSYDTVPFGSTGQHAGMSGLLRWRPTAELEIIPFTSAFLHIADSTQPRIITAGPFLPPRIERGTTIDQSWARNGSNEFNSGIIVRWSAGQFGVHAGAFRSVRDTDNAYSDQFLNTTAAGLMQHRIVATPPQRFQSHSGEVRLTRTFGEGDRRHSVSLAARARDQKRRYGGSAAVDFGPASIHEPGDLEEPDFAFATQSKEHVKQVSGGIAYHGQWRGVGELSLGIQKTSYSKSADIPGRAEPVTESQPWLYNAAVAAHLTPDLALYAGLTRGLEESPVAPDTATNRDEGPPAILTRQYDAGLRWAITPTLRLVGGLFNVEKPYFNLDESRLYRRLGEVRHRGIELSLTGSPFANFNLVAGAVLLDAEVRGEAVEAGVTGRRPVGSTRRTLILSGEYQLPTVPGLSIDAGLNSYGRRIANTDNSLTVPAVTVANAGLRYRWTQGKVPASLRFQVTNLFNAYFWEVRASNAFFYNFPRLASLRLTVDL